jgi:hypothetical protein
MADEDDGRFTIKFLREAFTALVGNIPIALLRSQLVALPLTVPVTDARMTLSGNGVLVEWIGEPPSAQDRIDVRAKVAGFVGGTTTSEPFSVLSAAVTTASNATLVDKIDFTTPPLDEGTYSITYTGQHRLQSGASGDSAGVRLTITFSGFPPFFQEDEWPFALKHGYDYAVTGKVSAGQTIRVQAQLYKLGAGAAIAECSKARFTVDKIS